MSQIARRLLLLRHAKATTLDPGPTGEHGDHARDLSDQGRHDASALGRELRRLAIRPDLALMSSARRTKRTWELLGLTGPTDDATPTVVMSDQLYLAEPSALLAMLREVPGDVGTLLLIGHNPGLHALALQLAGTRAPASLRAGLSTCMLVSFMIDAEWRALDPAASDRVSAPQVIRP